MPGLARRLRARAWLAAMSVHAWMHLASFAGVDRRSLPRKSLHADVQTSYEWGGWGVVGRGWGRGREGELWESGNRVQPTPRAITQSAGHSCMSDDASLPSCLGLTCKLPRPSRRLMRSRPSTVPPECCECKARGSTHNDSDAGRRSAAVLQGALRGRCPAGRPRPRGADSGPPCATKASHEVASHQHSDVFF